METDREEQHSERVLVTGAAGIVGRALVGELRERLGAEAVVAGYRSARLPTEISESGPHCRVDVSDADALTQVVTAQRVQVIYHLAAVLSSAAAQDLDAGWRANVVGLYNVLETARRLGIRQVFFASSIAVFGETTPKNPTPQDTVLRPASFYGVSKRFGEMLGAYYSDRYGVDVRGLRYPGIISAESVEGERTISRTVVTDDGPKVITGSTDFVTPMIRSAVRGERHVCYFEPETVLPLMYIADCVKATLDLMHADPRRLVHRSEYNLRGMEFSAGELAEELRRQVPGFQCDFRPDDRQLLADATARKIDETAAREEWDWTPAYDLPMMTTELVAQLRAKLTPRDRRDQL